MSASCSLLLSDIHLSEERPAQVERFVEILAGPARSAEALYILGDLFEYWVGDDDCAAPLAARVIRALSETRAAGCQTFLLQGNRDFLLGTRFAALAQVTLLDDPVRVDLQGVPTILMHGDLLCTDDVDYLAFRAETHAEAWQARFLAQPLPVRHQIAYQATAASGRAKQLKERAIMDVTEEAVAAVFRRFDCTRLIHGHTHRPAHHLHWVDGLQRERWVLPDWYGPGGYLRATPGGIEAIGLPP